MKQIVLTIIIDKLLSQLSSQACKFLYALFFKVQAIAICERLLESLFDALFKCWTLFNLQTAYKLFLHPQEFFQVIKIRLTYYCILIDVQYKMILEKFDLIYVITRRILINLLYERGVSIIDVRYCISRHKFDITNQLFASFPKFLFQIICLLLLILKHLKKVTFY
ncbi:hypothetical protein FGO68_gene15459 [Halteria grandinella]|uniref:Transmembrane protein n=1 Tax=Halteria grandinella TaxID=5974 RepID=A0A8J8P1D0_HALGN|nr:hypothetical protein FGO68_gene15459 [Halteria grandinella]